MDADGYPDIEDYDQIKTLNGRNVLSDYNVLLSLFESTGYGSGKIFESKDSLDNPIYVLQLHTGGWSGCEDMISKLQEENQIFWIMHWHSVVRGGHYEFHGRAASNNSFNLTQRSSVSQVKQMLGGRYAAFRLRQKRGQRAGGYSVRRQRNRVRVFDRISF